MQAIGKESVTLREAGKDHQVYVNGQAAGGERVAAKATRTDDQDLLAQGQTVFIQSALIDDSGK